ncbi:hypothetical protein HYFRA_00002378 [Hymenoscyphus fraxineus]|uniref:Pkinase-domain-containing protein n=1 Tax=Hymenoscyphus fraxineus TaxID=746836 RepID=A0A9N9L990_9HELO|nr:hypothetical protein HYFRA_00002378 [Hymenoscyphus fraxineus]
MAPRGGKAQLKRGRAGTNEDKAPESSKKPRRSQRHAQGPTTPVSKKQQLPSPITHQESTSSSEAYKEATATPPEGRPSQIQHRSDHSSLVEAGFSSPPQETQPFSQFIFPTGLSEEVNDEVEEGVWGYLHPLDPQYGKTLVLKRRNACPLPDTIKTKNGTNCKGKTPQEEEDKYEDTKLKGIASGGYLIGRHPECDLIIDDPIISNRHCLLFTENKGGETIAVVEDLSSNGTFVNEAMLGRNKRRELKDQDEITVKDGARFAFRYPRRRDASTFMQQYTLLEKLGKGHFAEVFLCIEKSTGQRYAVKVFTKQPGVEERSKTEGLQQEIAVLMGVSHPNMLCLKGSFDEPNAVYLVLELAAEGELFNWIVMKQKLTEEETRKVFIQLFQGMKYLHDRDIVHRDIKPENILLTDKDLHVKLADFGLAKMIGEESFTTTLCGTPSYVAPEILEESRHRRYTRAVDVWSLGVVLYICLCGFPPFSDELYTRENPYTLTQQIKMGRFDYPSPYWDSVGDPALDLIDRMLNVDVEKRYTIDDCLEHPWTTQKLINPNDSTDGLVGGIANLDFTKRKMARERTLISSLNDVKVSKVIETENSKEPVKVYVKNPNSKSSNNKVNNTAVKVTPNGTPKSIPGPPKQEETPANDRDPEAFMALGGKGDPVLLETGGSVYSVKDDGKNDVEDDDKDDDKDEEQAKK